MITLKKSSMKYKDPQDGSMKDVGAIIGGNVGKDGEDGFSPIAKVEETENGAIITIVDKNGETSVNIKNGENGSDGNNGADGISITKSEINADGNLVITYSDETTTVLGKVVGENGKDGKDGKDGINGKDGMNGANGISVTKAEITNGGNLLITLSSGVVISVGKVKDERVTVIDENATNEQVPTAKAVYECLEGIETILASI